MKLRTFDTILSFLLGMSWAFVLVGTFFTYSLFSFLGFLPALFASFLFIFIGFILILLLEALMMYRQNFDEKRKQTQLLEEIRDALHQE
jgi:NADH:ubiquinone oxidoreductase subunit 6 (subunit J)